MSSELDQAEDIRRWLMQMPRPTVVRVTDAEGVVHEVLCGQSTWVKVSETLAVMRPDLLQALNDKGAIIRACRPNDMSHDWSPPEATARAPSRPLPAEIPLTALDPESQKFALFARLIADAYRHSTDVAFERLSEMLEAQNRRAEAVEAARESFHRAHVRQLEEQIKQLGEQPREEPQDLLGGLVSSFLQGAATSAAETQVVNGSNGKGHVS